MFKKLIAVGATLAVALGIVALVAMPAEAHNHTVTPSCDGLTVSLTNYQGGQGTHVNTVSVTINGTVVAQNDDFGTTYHFTQAWDDSQANTYRVVVTAWDSSAYSFDTGTQTQKACVAPTATLGTVTPTQAACDAQHPGAKTGASFVITGGEHVSYRYTLNGGPSHTATVGSSVSVDVTSGPVAVVVTPTATDGYQLPSYDATKWAFTLSPVAGDCLSHLTVNGHPSVQGAVCTGAGAVGTGSVSFPALPAGAVWQYSTSSSTGPWTDAPATLTGLTGGAVVHVQIVALPGYTIDSGTTTFTESVASADASKCVVPVPPTPTQAVCDQQHAGTVTAASYTVPGTRGIVYQVAGRTVSGTVTVPTADLPTTITVTAVAKRGFTIPSGTTTSFTLSFTAKTPGDCVQPATHGEPTFVDATCNVQHPGQQVATGYTLPVATGVDYYVSVDGATATKTPAGDYAAHYGDTIVVTEQAQAGYSLDAGYPVGGYTHTFAANPGDCLVQLTVTATAAPQTCAVDQATGYGVYTNGSITITLAEHVVSYTVDGTPVDTTGKTAGDTVTVADLAPGQHTVAVQTESGYTATGFPLDLTVDQALACGELPPHALIMPVFTANDPGCFSSGSYLLATDDGDTSAILWTVNGSSVAEGSYRATAGTTYLVTARPAPGNGFTNGAPEIDFTFTPKVAAGTCDLKTLALTGTGNPTGWIGLGYLLVISGLALAAVSLIRRRRSAEG